MLVVIPVCHKDISIAIRNIEWLISIEERVDFHAVISHEEGFDVSGLIKLSNGYFSKVSEVIYPKWRGPEEWPQPQNNCWQETARIIQDKFKEAWFFWEPDAIPLKPHWLDCLREAHKEGMTHGRPFCGATAEQMGYRYTVGVAIYPPNPSNYMIASMLTLSQPWDIVASQRDGILDKTHDISSLICHTPDRINTHFSSVQDIHKLIPDSAVLFHKCKDGSLLDVLQGGRKDEPSSPQSLETHPSVTQQTAWESGLFTFPCWPGNTCYFNCSLVKHLGKLWLFTRRCRFSRGMGSNPIADSLNDLAIFEIRSNMTLSSIPIIPTIPYRSSNEQFEDPRALVVDDRVYIAFANWIHFKPWPIRQIFTRLTPDWRRIDILFEPEFGGNHPQASKGRGHEKNWVWFHASHARHQPPSWHCIYTINPHVVFRVDYNGTVVQKWEGPDITLPWEFGEIRGGTPPFLLGDEYLCFFHSALMWQKPKRRYYMGAYTFSAEPPYEFLRMTKEPLLIGSEEDVRSLGGPLVVFPNGAILEESNWVIVFGINDEACGWIKIPFSDIEERLIEVGKRKGIFSKLVDTLVPA